MALDSLDQTSPAIAKGDFLSLKSRPYPIEIHSKGKRSKRQRSAAAAATSELEQGALDLMLLSRDGCYSGVIRSDDSESSESQLLSDHNGGKQLMTYQCSVCGKSFGSYQALGGHKTSHRKPVLGDDAAAANGNNALPGVDRVKVHQCKICLRTFPSGQALGGHKRLHYEGGASAVAAATKLKFEFDLNMPAPEVDAEPSGLVKGRDGDDHMVDFLGVKKQRLLLTA